MNTREEEQEFLQLHLQKYREHITNLPLQITPFGIYSLYEGFWIPIDVIERIKSLSHNPFVIKPTDILLCSAPKSGTNWLKALAFSIITRTKFEVSSSPLLETTPHECVPFLEFIHAPDSPMRRDQELPLLASHLPYTSLPKSIVTSSCKIIYMYREPKDVLVSLWHFQRTFIPKGMSAPNLDVFYEIFLKGYSPFGSFWEHVLSYWKASLERPGTILLLKYEDLMNDTEFHVKKIADFMGYPFSPEEEKEGVVEKLVKLCNFETLSNLNVNKTGKHHVDSSMVVNNNIFFRKGKSGDWKNYLTPEMAEKMDKITEEKFGSCGLMVPSKSHYKFWKQLSE